MLLASSHLIWSLYTTMSTMESLGLPIMYALIFLAIILAYCALRGLKLLKQMSEQPDPSTRRGRLVSFLRDLPNYRQTDIQQHNQTYIVPNTVVRQLPAPVVLAADSLATYLAPVHQGPVGVSGLHSGATLIFNGDLAATFPPPVLGAAVPWPGAFGTMIDREFSKNFKADDSGIFSTGSQGRTSLESLSSSISNV